MMVMMIMTLLLQMGVVLMMMTTQFGSTAGPAGRQVLLRLFTVIDANGTGSLEFEVGA